MTKLIALLFGLLFLTSSSFAASAVDRPITKSVPEPYGAAGYMTLNSQVVFDGEGEASVGATLYISNPQAELRNVTITIPGDTVRVRRVLEEYDVQVEKTGCSRYKTDDTSDCSDSYTYNTTERKVEAITATETKTDDGLKLELVLPKIIGTDENGYIDISYKAIGLAQKGAGGVFKFEYLTPKVSFDVDNVQVRVDVQEDLVIKGGKAKVEYQEALSEKIAEFSTDAIPSGFSGLDHDVYYDQDALVKSASSLDPNESFKVGGQYAENWLALYWPQVLALVIGFILLIGIVVWGERKIGKN